MNDDWDGVDWAENFSGPDDDAIEQRRDQEWQEIFEHDPSNVVQTYISWAQKSSEEVTDSGYLYSSFEVASDRARYINSLSGTKYRVEVVECGWVLKSDPVEEIDRLVEKITDEDSKFFIGVALFRALENRQHARAVELLERPLEVNVTGESGSSSLMIAAYRGYVEVCQQLLKLGATFQTGIEIPYEHTDRDKDEPAYTVMQCALLSQDWPTIEAISKVFIPAEWTWIRANMCASDIPHWGYPRLVEAARYGMSALCAEMIGHGVDIDGPVRSVCNEPPIEAAFSNDQLSTCLVLAAMGADFQPLLRMDGWTDELEIIFSNISKYCRK